jgi:hypothetical protein
MIDETVGGFDLGTTAARKIGDASRENREKSGEKSEIGDASRILLVSNHLRIDHPLARPLISARAPNAR